ncbi:ABC-2 type transport system permease protein [Actinoalloteichus hoggarensis]|uniref:Transport permease protein n=1 Tax=Actinoalloteichus hoggarensis TaxID=1470176 RepID=A0A221W4T3_9PSEU|nr:ABC transporter permease [Actinoalloteichus hoggarensis]ASO20661.1 Daunorubicin/doxorubicin resistance ABC transporter permease protein DrrB [Actinoalloteichus hoggarensis]MBB5924486.1 ABC-2 type transport system permease protein [Actinoalloteichus hoggarensis]
MGAPIIISAAEQAPSRWRGSSVLTQVSVLTGRSLRASLGDHRVVTLNVIQPMVILVLFTQVFGSLANSASFPAGVDYIDFLMPAILVNTSMQCSIQSGVGLVDDMRNGMLNRLRSMPIRSGSILVARSVSDLTRTAFQLLVIYVLAIVFFGYLPVTGAVGVVGTLGLALVVGWGMSWVFLALGAWLRNAELMQSISVLTMIPLMFVSSAYVPIADLPGWLAAVATVNPLTYAVDAARAVSLDLPGVGAVLAATAISLVIAVLGAVFAVAGFRRPR